MACSVLAGPALLCPALLCLPCPTTYWESPALLCSHLPWAAPAVLCPALLSPALPRPALPCSVLLCSTLSVRFCTALLCSALPYLDALCPALPALFPLTLHCPNPKPYRALPCPSVTSHWSQTDFASTHNCHIMAIPPSPPQPPRPNPPPPYLFPLGKFSLVISCSARA